MTRDEIFEIYDQLPQDVQNAVAFFFQLCKAAF